MTRQLSMVIISCFMFLFIMRSIYRWSLSGSVIDFVMRPFAPLDGQFACIFTKHSITFDGLVPFRWSYWCITDRFYASLLIFHHQDWHAGTFGGVMSNSAVHQVVLAITKITFLNFFSLIAPFFPESSLPCSWYFSHPYKQLKKLYLL